ncbi:lamin tail domain-containing protein [Bacillus sp. JJ1533]|uniref:lamin tail domain-containing protein n=1 Tax=Bacillus sp. JJ1533 TaxID=3122959 RepID=UPI003000CC11
MILGKRVRNKLRKGLIVIFTLTILLSNISLATGPRMVFAEGGQSPYSTPESPNQQTEDLGEKSPPQEPNKAEPDTQEQPPETQHNQTTETDPETEEQIETSDESATEEVPQTQKGTTTEGVHPTEEEPPSEAEQPTQDGTTIEEGTPQAPSGESTQPTDGNTDQLPHLLITEISPNSKGAGTDYYEYFELYNNTNQPQTLTNYTFTYRYTDTGKDLLFQIPATTIEPQETLVFWFNNGNRTLADFNENFGTALPEEKVIQFTDVFPGFANGGNRAIVIKNHQGTEIISASYLAGETDNTGAVVEYKYPETGTEMAKHQVLAQPTPGEIQQTQVPETPVNLPDAPEDIEAPVITHTPITSSKPLTPIQVEANVTDNLAIPSVTLFYKIGDSAEFTALPMSPNEQTYIAEIPSFHVYDGITYYLEASDGVNTEKTDEFTIQVVQPEVDFTQIPHLLVTEIVPDSTNVGTADGYEFIEIYNNSSEAIHFKDYKMYYRYGTDPGTDVVWPSVPEDVVIPAGETLVFWIINTQNGGQTVADFNANYGSNLVENENIVRIYSDGMANGSMRGLVIGTNTHKEISVAYYNDEPNVDDTFANKGIVYLYPTDKSTISKKVGILDATPGRVEGFQVPSQPVQMEEDTVPPTIENLTKTTEVNQKDNINIVANVTDDKDVKSVRLFYKIDQQDKYSEAILQENYDDLLYHHTVYSPDLIGHKYVDYYFVVSDGKNEVKSESYRVTITNDLDDSSLRLNLNNGEMIRGEKIIKATSAVDSSDKMKLLIDGKEITEGIYPSLEHTAYFAFEVNGLNTYFQNAVTMGEEVLYVMDQDWLTQWKTFSIPIEPERLPVGDTTITVRSGNKASPFDLGSAENRDDYDLRNVRLVLADGTVIKDPNYSDPARVLKMNDNNPFVDFTFTITEKEAHSLTYKWDTTAIKDKKHKVLVQDTDEEISAEVLVDNTAPDIKTNLKKKAYKGAFTIDVDVKDKLSGVGEVLVTLDGKEIQVPFETASSKLEAGKHELKVIANDKVGNQKEEVFHFEVADENPMMPELVSPKINAQVDGDPVLQVKVKDPTKDQLDVTFYEAHQYDVNSSVKGFKNAGDFEPPQEMIPEGETAFTSEDNSLVSKADGKYLVSDSDTQFPYHRFEVTVDASLDDKDRVELLWKGNSLEGRKVSMYAWNHSTEKWTLIDYKVAGKEDFELAGDVGVGDFVRQSKINVIIQDEIPSSPDEYDYTFVWMSDTQFYSESYPYIFDRQTQWIAEMKEKLKIKYVFHTGDLVNKSNQEYQWKNADKAMRTLDDNNIPYGVLAGNHDVDQVSNDYSQFYKYFGEERFKNKPYYGGSYLNNRGHYDLISAGGNDYIMVYLGWAVTDEGIQWVNDVLAAHPDRKAILNFHEYLLATGTRHPLGDKLFNEIVVPNKNVFMVLSGHYHEAQTLADQIDDDGDGTPDRTVTQMLADYQAGPEGGQGYMRLLHFDQDNNRIVVNTYSPYLDDYNFYNTDAYPEKDEFVIEMDLAPVTKRVATDYFSVNVYTDHVIGTDKAKSGKIAETVWKGLEKGRTYSWYAIVEDKYTGRTVSDIWTFRK